MLGARRDQNQCEGPRAGQGSRPQQLQVTASLEAGRRALQYESQPRELNASNRTSKLAPPCGSAQEGPPATAALRSALDGGQCHTHPSSCGMVLSLCHHSSLMAVPAIACVCSKRRSRSACCGQAAAAWPQAAEWRIAQACRLPAQVGPTLPQVHSSIRASTPLTSATKPLR